MFCFCQAEDGIREGALVTGVQTCARPIFGGHVPERSWTQRLEQLRAFPSLRQASQFLDRTVRPALDDVAAEFWNQGYEIELSATANTSGIQEPLLRKSVV